MSMKLPFTQELMNGKGEPLSITFRRAAADDIDAVLALQSRMYDALPDKDLCITMPRDEFETQLAEDVCFAAEYDGKIIGFSIMIPNDPDNPRNYGKYVGYDRERKAKTVSFDVTMVDPEYRGRGLQRIFNKLRIGEAVARGAAEGLTTISPDNPYSYRNFLVLNFEIMEEREMYGGKKRYILRKEF